MSRTMLFLGLAASLLVPPASAQENDKVTLDVVKYDGLAAAVSKHRGKVVLVDFWGNF